MQITTTRRLHRQAIWIPHSSNRAALPEPLRAACDTLLAVDRVAVLPSMGQWPCAAVAVHADVEPEETVLWRRRFRRLGKAAAARGTHCCLDIDPEWSLWQQRVAVLGVIEGSYRFERYRSEPKSQLEQLDLLGGNRALAAWAQSMAQALAWCRDLINTPAEDMGPEQLVAATKLAAQGSGLRITVLSQAQCQRLKMGALLAVGRASHRPARMLVVDLPGKGPLTALCGKGVCFDTGGLNIKTGKSMDVMRKDMGGAATVLATMLAAAHLGSKRRLRAYVPLVENAIGPDAFRPGDIVRVCDGTSVEIGNTDAEGRLILADAIAYARKQKAERIISVATLTGAALVALGRIHVPLMGDDEPVQALLSAADRVGEKCWRLPLDDDHLAIMRGVNADLRNDGNGEAGCITAGAFLRYFAGNVPFLHADISPASWRMSDDDQGIAGATGVLLSSLLEAVASA